MLFFFFFNDTATTEIYTLSLHDALPILSAETKYTSCLPPARVVVRVITTWPPMATRRSASAEGMTPPGSLVESRRSEEHTSELQSRLHLVCRLLLEKKKKNNDRTDVRPCPEEAVS